MRLIHGAEDMEVVSAGLPWRHAMPPCAKAAIALLERNTKVVTWLMPRGGQPHEQIPCILYKERYYSLSLRMQKAIYRHIRLKKGFRNEERVNGTAKLRIPDLLLKEKIRTQSRFDVCGPSPLFLLSLSLSLTTSRRPCVHHHHRHRRRRTRPRGPRRPRPPPKAERKK